MKRKSSSSSSSKNNKVKQKKKKKSNSSIRSLKKSNIRRIDDNSRKKNTKKKNNKARLAVRLAVPRQQRQKKHQQSYSKSSKSLLKKKEERQQQQQQPQQLFIKRSSGRKENFDTNRMAQTVSRSGVPFLMARDVAKKISTKIRNETNDSAQQITKRKRNAGGNKVVVSQTKLKREKEQERTVTAGRIRNLVANELRDRNRSDIAASYTGQMPENTLQEQNLKDKQPIEDIVAANKNRVLHDTSKRGGGIMT
jgi:hypothetical protein